MTSERQPLRARLRALRRTITPSQRIEAAQSLAQQLLALPFAPASGPVAGYWAVDGEIALHAWQTSLPSSTTYCLPVLRDSRKLTFAPWCPGHPLVTNRYGIPEPDVDESALIAPEDMRLVIVPLVGFATSGHRLGMGAGWYDRSFAFRQHAAAPPWLVGAGFAAQQIDDIAHESWDVALDAICTEQTTHISARMSSP